jgi:hypothetical protein
VQNYSRGYLLFRGIDGRMEKGMQLNNRTLVNIILYADGQILMATSEDEGCQIPEQLRRYLIGNL